MPTSTSTSPAAKPSSKQALLGGRDEARQHPHLEVERGEALKNVSKCCWARMVVGHSTMTCLPSWQHLNAARRATSVLPKPTSPQSRRSIGRSDSMSALMSATAAAWSGVSW